VHLERDRPVAADRLVDRLRTDQSPPDAAGALASVVSKLRTALQRADDGTGEVITASAEDVPAAAAG